MKFKDLIFNIYISIFGDRNKKKFMIELINLTENNESYMNLIRDKSNGNSNYLEELFLYWKNNGNIETKLKYDKENNI